MDPRVLLPLEEVYLGEGYNSALKMCAEARMDAEVRDLRNSCLSFYQTAAVEVKKGLQVGGSRRQPSAQKLEGSYLRCRRYRTATHTY
ncbi:hypothetical protein HPB48_004410 [Haemaphysalis longicornis]|uniref:Uncharacterized protein n=1 Tax=Haemaphysalis longicornis TaxID=44386 RepID=A0A9J6G1R2_HAELO|nr:hypothetical protein HPB48_004410 [Haemaphysalis longicornis]